ncbi:MAG TPA: translation elongation factor Ts [Candidatus Nanoarchaeia archaeon]|nr:elongation factor Ts [uncultured archaeon]
MTEISAEEVKKLREETGAPVMDVRKALLEASGDHEKAKEILKAKGEASVAKRAERETVQGVIETYIHAGGKVGSMVYLACETDFVAKTDEFKTLAKELSMQVAAMNPTSVDELLQQEYIRDQGKIVKQLVTEVIAKTGENIRVMRIARFSLGE